MDRQRRSRYVLAVYMVVLSLAVILILAGPFFTVSLDWKSVWINLGTSLLGVVVLFFLVQRFFLADAWGLSDRIEQLVRRLELSERPSARDFFVKAPALDDYVRSAMQIDMCGVTLTSAVNKQFGNLRERLAQGATLRLLIADSDSLVFDDLH
jgi:low affinity Fe/Cu permease